MKVLVITLCLCVQFALACASNVALMPIRDIKPGMQGIGKTVIAGDRIEEFNVEILGVQGNEATGYSIFVRLYGDLIEKTGGVAQGMSGSPVYVDGRLVGAVAYGRVFNDPHYCFLTPIGRMLSLLDEPQSLPNDWLPKGTALQAGGFTEQGLAYLKEKLAPLGLEAVGSSGVGTGSAKELEPGSAVGAAIMQGDLTLGALGTVTWTDDKGNVLAFGHPFMQRGNSNFYMTKVWILGVVPNMQSSYKVGNMGESIGSFTQDRASGIGGTIGNYPKTIPVFVTANDTGRGQGNSMRARVIEDERLAPAVVDAAVMNTLTKTIDRSGGGTARLHFTITGVDSKKENLVIDRENMYYSADALLKNVDAELTEALTILLQNKFEHVDIYGINVEAEVSDAVQIAEIQRVRALQNTVAPGEKLSIEVALKPYRGEEFTKTIQFKVPKDHTGGKLALQVRGGSSMAWIIELLRKQQQEGVPAAKKQEKQRTLADYVKSVNTADKNNEIIVDISTGAQQMNAQNAAPAADAGLAGMLAGSPFKQKYPFDFIIDGESEITVNVRK